MSSSSSTPHRDKVYGYCECGYKLYPRTSWTVKNPGRRFISCPKLDSSRKCGMYRFLDEELPSEYYKDLLYDLHHNVVTLKAKERLDSFEDFGESTSDVAQAMEELNISKAKMKVFDKICRFLLCVIMILCIFIGYLLS